MCAEARPGQASVILWRQKLSGVSEAPSDLNKPGLWEGRPPGEWDFGFLSPTDDRTLYVSVGYLSKIPEPNSTRNVQGGIFNHIISKDKLWRILDTFASRLRIFSVFPRHVFSNNAVIRFLKLKRPFHFLVSELFLFSILQIENYQIFTVKTKFDKLRSAKSKRHRNKHFQT